MAKTNDHEESNKKMKKNLDNWKFPKIHIDQIYKKRLLRLFPSYAINDFQETIPLKDTNESVTFKLVTRNFLEKFVKDKHKFLHLGLVQIAIKPLMRDGLGGSIIVCLKDGRHVDFKSSILAMVESDLSKGPFYFNCFPSFSVSLSDFSSNSNVLTLSVKASGAALALTYRIVCKAMVDLKSDALELPTLEETLFFQADLEASNTTKWNDVEVPESWTRRPEPVNQMSMQSFSRGFVVRSGSINSAH